MIAKDLIELLTYLSDHPLALIIFMACFYLLCTVRLFDIHFHRNETVINESDVTAGNGKE